MKAAKRDADEYPELIEAEASDGVLVRYMRVSSVKEREARLLQSVADFYDATPSQIYVNAGVRELE